MALDVDHHTAHLDHDDLLALLQTLQDQKVERRMDVFRTREKMGSYIDLHQ